MQNLITYISQVSVATRLRCGGIFTDSFIANFLESVQVKEFLTLVNIWRRYRQEYGVSFLLTHGVEEVVSVVRNESKNEE